MKFRTPDDDRERTPSINEPQTKEEPSSADVAAAFLASADEAIARIMSGNAEQFLNANRQQGGE